jgi:hypothetical protein
MPANFNIYKRSYKIKKKEEQSKLDALTKVVI